MARRKNVREQDIKARTVGELRDALREVPDHYEVILGVNDENFNLAGGIYEQLEEVYVRPDEEDVQLNIWADIVEIGNDDGGHNDDDSSMSREDYERAYGPHAARARFGNPGVKRRTHRAEKKRKSNTHDPDRSTRHFEAAIDRAERDLTAAATTGLDGKMQQSLKLLLSATYWLGRAASEEKYARSVRPEAVKRLRSLESSMSQWPKNFLSKAS